MDSKSRVLIDYIKVKYYCKKQRLTIAELADKLGVARQTIRSWSVKNTSIVNAWRLEDVLEVKTNEIFTIVEQ